MKKTMISYVPIVLLFISLLAACGGSVDTVPPPQSQPTEAVMTLSTSVAGSIPAGTTINSYDVTVTLPAGVTVKSTTNPPETDYGVVTATGSAAGAFIGAVYTAPTSTRTGMVNIHIASAAGFGAGEFSIVNCDIARGSNPKSTDFQAKLDDATGFDANSSSTVLGLDEQLLLTRTVVFH